MDTAQPHPLELPEAFEESELQVGASAFLPRQLGVIATRAFVPGEELFLVEGPITARRTRYTFQCGRHEHIDPLLKDGRPGLGHFTNHSCDPNAYVELIVPADGEKFLRVVVRRGIKAGDEVTVDYSAMEYSIANPAECLCGTPRCRGRITGFADLPQLLQRSYLEEGIAPVYLGELVALRPI